MRGSVRELRPGRWQLRVYLGRDPVTRKDRYRTKTVAAVSKRTAENELPAFIVTLQAAPVATHGTVAHLLEQTIAHLRDRDREASTLRGYAGITQQVNDVLGDLPLDTVTPQHINRYYTAMRKRGAKPGTIGNHHRFLRRAFNLAIRWGWLADNPVKRADPPEGRPSQIVPPSSDMLARLIEAARQSPNPELAFAFVLIAALGCRRGEACGLQWADIDLDTGTVTIRRAVKQLTRQIVGDVDLLPAGYQIVGRALIVGDVKTHQTRRLTVGPSMLVMLNGQHAAMRQRATGAGVLLAGGAYVLSDAKDGSLPWRPDRLTKAVVDLRDGIGWPDGRLHDLRHWNASHLLDSGEDDTIVAERGGWRDKATLRNVYAHMLPAGDERAAQIIDDALFGKDELRKRRKQA